MHTVVARTNSETGEVEYVVGFAANMTFRSFKVFADEATAAAYAAFLNGGPALPEPAPEGSNPINEVV